jgi:hypothetical protein
MCQSPVTEGFARPGPKWPTSPPKYMLILIKMSTRQDHDILTDDHERLRLKIAHNSGFA